MKKLEGKKVAILVADGFEESEFTEPKKFLEEQGAEVDVVSPNPTKVRGMRAREWADEFPVDVPLSEAHADDYVALVLPGGVYNPDALRGDASAVSFVRAFFADDRQRPVAAICHGPQTLINAGVVKGRHMTSYPSVRKDLENAGALWEDKDVVVDHGLVTSRKPSDIPAFNRKMLEEIVEGEHLLRDAPFNEMSGAI